MSTSQNVALYTRRMQIELSFRDLKSHRDGQGFEDSFTRKSARIEVLLLLSTLAEFETWLVGVACKASGIDTWLTPYRSKRRLYSLMRLAFEALVRDGYPSRHTAFFNICDIPVRHWSINWACQHEKRGETPEPDLVVFAITGLVSARIIAAPAMTKVGEVPAAHRVAVNALPSPFLLLTFCRCCITGGAEF